MALQAPTSSQRFPRGKWRNRTKDLGNCRLRLGESTRSAAPLAMLCAWLAAPALAAETTFRVDRPPAPLAESYELAPFYKKHVDVGGFPVLSSDKASDFALLEAAYLIDHMLSARADIRRALVQSKTRFVVMAPAEMTTEVPEHGDLQPKAYWDRRARGLGATDARPAVSCGEENLLCLPGDPYAAENILIHEFAHAMHQMGLDKLDGDFDRRLRQAYDRAMEDGLWKGKYAAANHHEYWAEGVQSWFDTNRPPDHDHNHVNTREELKEYDPRLAAIVAEVFGDGQWRYVRPANRMPEERAHLEGFDPEKAGKFVWPAALEKVGEKIREDAVKKRSDPGKPAKP